MKILRIIFFTALVLAFFSSCQKEYSVELGGNGNSSGTWEFQESTVQYKGNIDSAVIRNIGTTKILTLEGKELTGQTNFSLQLFATDSFIVGSYRASLSESKFDYFTSAKTIFQADFLTGEFIVTIASISNNKIEGTFTGQAVDSSGNPTQITLGSFSSTIDLTNNGNGGGGTTAVGTLSAVTGTCTPVTPGGVYTQGTLLSASNTVQLEVSVSTPGAYAITTNTVNGVIFSTSGTFSATGVYNVTLNGSGTPVDPGDHNFTVTFGTDTCVFPITFLPGTPINADYFPTTLNSNWTYGLQGATSDDSVAVTVLSFTPTFEGQVYAALGSDSIPSSGFPDTSYFRKAGNDYYEYIDPSSIFLFDDSSREEYIFLKDNVDAGTTFQSPDFTGTVAGTPETGYIKMTIIEKGVAATVGTLSFSDVIKVRYEYFISFIPGTAATEERWFARGVGLIHDNIDDRFIFNIGRYTVF